MKRIALNPEGDGSQQQTQQQQQQQEDETSAERRMSWNPADIHILVVDDETVTRLVLEQLLKKCGYQAITATDRGQSALELLRKFEYHVVLLDLRMPEMDGLQVLSEIMKDPQLRNIPVVMMSATEDLPLTYTCLRAGACHFLVKPIQAQTLKHLWQTIFKWRKQQKMALEFEQQRVLLEQQLQQLRRDMTHAVEAPIVTVVNTLHELVTQGTVSHETRQTLLDVLKALLASSNLYQPALDSIINNLPELDGETRRWLISELCIPETSLNASGDLSPAPPAPSACLQVSIPPLGSLTSSPTVTPTLSPSPAGGIVAASSFSSGAAGSTLPSYSTAPHQSFTSMLQDPPAPRPQQYQQQPQQQQCPATSFAQQGSSVGQQPSSQHTQRSQHQQRVPSLPSAASARRGSRSGAMAAWQLQVGNSFVASEEALRLGAWEFDVWQTANEDSLIDAMVEMWEKLGLLAVFHIEKTTLLHFLITVRAHYVASNPYHNFRHCADVVQAVYHELMVGGARMLLQPLEILSAMLAAAIHDIGHDGHNNAFHIATQSHLALLYNDKSVLENFHCSEGWKLVVQCGLLTGGTTNRNNNADNGMITTTPQMPMPSSSTWPSLTTDEIKIVRRLVVDAVLATDISQHMELTNKFKTVVASGFDQADDNHRAQLMGILVKLGDISNPCRPVHIAKHWARMVQEEFFLQGDRERRLHLPVSPFMDRGVSLAQMQLNFIDYIVRPLAAEVAVLLPNITPLLENLAANQEHWRALLDEEKRLSRSSSSTKQQQQPN